ncbi:MAG: regulatory iron-sulfur-containing complex subunit RicT [Candidatus Margulisbacteria bacterium]|nr:regulatory iron-sulfur-containing complex subunit RicT [Candidatus Margulisiibacteriota bacterium]
MSDTKPADKKQMAIKLRKFNRICPITGYREESIKVGAPVVVQTDRGVEFGEIIAYRLGLPRALSRDVRLKKVIRYATPEDMEKVKTIPALEEKGLAIAVQKAKEHELPIKIANIEYLFDTTRAIIYYKVEEGKSVKNLRDLTRDLSTNLEARVNLRQVSPRDEARILGGLGPCGRVLCCSVWLEKPKHVTVKMVKDQGLAISPTKTSGICGRLMCCLEYEHEK